MVERLVSCDWVAERLGAPGIRLVEVDVDTEAYGEGHIDGAVAWSWTSQIQEQRRRDVVGQADFEELMSRSGVANDTHVVLYGDNNNWFAAYALWLLELYGHAHASLMDGGRVKWLGDNRPTTTAIPQVERTAYRARPLDWALRARRDDVLGAVAAGVRLVDVRSPAEFAGEVIAPPGMSETAQRGGHIPGARNIPWARAVNEDGTFKGVDELRGLYAGAGLADGGAPAIVYCRIGERSAHTWFVLRHLLGRADVRNYDGSWTEYGSLIDVPIERGGGS
ncbi:MAG: sulfurtransferase [Chloroflexi bacterium]|nr:sulfurtransferase [Chloroflexota bacterium]